MSVPAIFLDKDGTLIEDVPYNVDPVLIRLRPGAGAALRAVQAAGYRLIVVSNQSGVARGLFAEQALGAVAARLRALLAAEQVALDAFLYCPHHPEGSVPAYAHACTCRKPAPGMLLHAARTNDIDLGRSWLFGDILDDMEAAHRAGCRAVLVDSGGETIWHMTPPRTPDAIVPDLIAAADVALAGPLSPQPPFPLPGGKGGASGRRSVRCTGLPIPGCASHNLSLPQGGRGSIDTAAGSSLLNEPRSARSRPTGSSSADARSPSCPSPFRGGVRQGPTPLQPRTNPRQSSPFSPGRGKGAGG